MPREELEMSDHQDHPRFVEIRKNIASSGHHVYLITAGPSPRFLYTIGLTPVADAELLLAGGGAFDAQEAYEIIEAGASAVRIGARAGATFTAGKHGMFSLRVAHESWVETLMLGATDFYRGSPVHALQIVPDAAHHTVDVPDTALALGPMTSPPWKWELEEWPYSVPKDAMAITNFAGLQGRLITEANRWEDDHWEWYAGSERNEDEMFIVPLATLIANDPSLVDAMSIPVLTGVAREALGDDWESYPIKEDAR
jgi:hypothetical protein